MVQISENLDRIERDLLTEWASYGPKTASDIRQCIDRLRRKGIRSLTNAEVCEMTDQLIPILTRNIRTRG